MRMKTNRTKSEANKKGPRKLKSEPLLIAQNVYKVRTMTTTQQRTTASKITTPVITIIKKIRTQHTNTYNNNLHKYIYTSISRKDFN